MHTVTHILPIVAFRAMCIRHRLSKSGSWSDKRSEKMNGNKIDRDERFKKKKKNEHQTRHATRAKANVTINSFAKIVSGDS